MYQNTKMNELKSTNPSEGEVEVLAQRTPIILASARENGKVQTAL